MKFGRTGLAVLGLFTVATVGCPQPSHKTFNDAGDETGGEGGEDGTGGSATGGKAGGTGGATGGSMGSTGGSMGSTGGSMGSTGGMMGSTGGMMGSTGGAGGGGAGGGGGGGGGGGAGGMMGAGASMAGWMTLYDGLIKPKCGPGCHITGTNGGLGMANAMAAFTNLVNKAGSANCMMQVRVKPGDPMNSLLYKKLAGTAGCGNKMPAGGKPAFTPAEMKMVEDWIKGG